METSLNTQLSTLGAFYPEQTLRALYNLQISPGRRLLDIPHDAQWRFQPGEPHYAILSHNMRPLSLRFIAIIRDAVVDSLYPHMTVIPLFERDATLCHSIFENSDYSYDWELEPDGVRPPVVLTIKRSPTQINTVTDSTNLIFTNTRSHPTLPIQILKRNDIIVASMSVELHAPILATPSYSFTAHHIALVHTSTDSEAGLHTEHDVDNNSVGDV
ncbi:hypothetical protein FKP32DRAFT_1578903 [Trametes sanguinea]|nr:hypothetical protein FKP32DRAFT_1578903 [Trametes sanguinea]